MSAFFGRLWGGVTWHLGWYGDRLYDLWINLSPLGYVAICFATIGVGWVFLSSSVKSLGR